MTLIYFITASDLFSIKNAYNSSSKTPNASLRVKNRRNGYFKKTTNVLQYLRIFYSIKCYKLNLYLKGKKLFGIYHSC